MNNIVELTIHTTIEVTYSDLYDLFDLGCNINSGIGHWCNCILPAAKDYKGKVKDVPDNIAYNDLSSLVEALFDDRYGYLIMVTDDGNYTISLKMYTDALQRYINEYPDKIPNTFYDILDTMDAADMDIVIQYATFGELRYT